MKLIHLHSSEEGFCGTKEQCRQWTPNPEDVTCRDCLGDNDKLYITEQGMQTLRECGYVTEDGRVI